jgi:glycosyltransferase involved in cell wall biosynthesis
MSTESPHAAEAESVGKTQKIAVVCSLTSSLVNFRFDLIKRMVDAGHEVTAFGPENCEATIEALDRLGVAFIRIPMQRVGLNPIADLKTCFALFRHFRRLKPDVILAYTMKPLIYGSIVARLAGVERRFAMITGLGYVFTDRGRLTARERLLQALAAGLYHLALRSAHKTIVYNEADRKTLLDARYVKGEDSIAIVPGSGINTERFAYSAPPAAPVTFLMIARLLKDKGLLEYAEAARLLKRRYPDVRVQLLGPFDPNPAGIKQAEIDAWVQEGIIDYLGATTDVRPYLQGCSVYVLPSYREGLSRTILEAMASGRPVITSDAPGCADAVDPERTGLVVPVRDAEALYQAMARFAEEPSLVERMGKAARTAAEERFDVHAVNRRLMTIMDLTPRAGGSTVAVTPLQPAAHQLEGADIAG